ncbi:MAG TPA: hypothetical protein PLR18_03000 [bacterium]|nr:hypothetical protein [bacterium]
MKKMILVSTALALAFLAGCATTYTGVERRNPKTGKAEPVVIVRDRGDDEGKIRAKAEFLGVSAASELAADTAKLSPTERLTAAALARGADETRALARVFREAGIDSSPTTGSPTAPTPSKVYTKDGAYWRWSDQPWWYFKEDTAGAHKLSRDNVRDYLAAPDEKLRALKIWGLVNE